MKSFWKYKTRPESPAGASEPVLVLRDDEIISTVARLQRRIGERFPDSGLFNLCGQLLDLSRQASERSRWINRPILLFRISGYGLGLLLSGLLIGMVFYYSQRLQLNDEDLQVSNFLSMIEAASNEAVLLGAGIFFLFTLETRVKRRRALAAIHELRSIAHVIDMHQLTKDPERTQKQWQSTATSPVIQLTPLLLNRYLDYCSEMLSLTGKVAALYVQRFDDPVSLAAVSEIEQLTTGMSSKIWQKIINLQDAK
ncbi:hypothetical protein [Roseimaritima sediminicola]|uniref:hypothetical protein n=1 Tax=Roseimaritima sediminicola TaxID=2662066 RepID=UPI001F40AE86|nr:hypothetical protein [Roseimaritima sediminicola]